MIDIDVSKIVSEIGEPTAHLIENEEEKRQRILAFVFSLVFLFLMVAGTIVFYVLDLNYRKATAQMEQDNQGVQAENLALVNVEKESIAIRNRNNDALSLIQNNPNWSYVFEQLQNVVPSQGIILTSFDVASSESMKISGNAGDYPTLSTLVVAMDQFTTKDINNKDVKVFDKVSLDNASLRVNKEKTQVDFTISFGFIKNINKESVNPLINNGAAITPTQNENLPVTPATPSPTMPDTNTPVTPSVPTTPVVPNQPVIPTPTPNEGGLPVL